MGIDLIAGGRYVGHKNREAPLSKNVYLELLVQLYRFLARRTDSKVNKVILKRLYMSRVNRPPLSVARLARYMKGTEVNQSFIPALTSVFTISDLAKMPSFRSRRLLLLYQPSRTIFVSWNALS
jgi:hypothetical protein